ncbi:hypothetical protein DAPK24_030510 [Pichia kluyveri]|uniref:Uncharacterized protein n=1 Tax=Pichia kluyveri TaxID=36015 RepID=A0AAV5R5D4_PICKL|nr:hypothetical protein DAPK24_030510 [Pichia kluyveri]
MQTDTQLRILVKTTKSKLEFKLTKSRALSTHTIQTSIIPDLQKLSQLDNNSRSFERGLDILRMSIAQLVRDDRTTDVWEDLIGEMAVLESSIHSLSSMLDKQRELNLINSKIQEGSNNNRGKKVSGWSLFGFGSSNTPASREKLPSELQYQEIDRLSKVIRNVVVAQEYLADDVKELKKLASAIVKCIDLPYLLKNSPPTEKGEVKKVDYKDEIEEVEVEVEEEGEVQDTDKPELKLELEDKIYVEIVRKLRGDDEDAVVNDYISELSDVYRIDLYNEGKYDEEQDEEDDTKDGDKDEAKDDNYGTSKPPSKKQNKQFDELDDLKQRFNALKRS